MEARMAGTDFLLGLCPSHLRTRHLVTVAVLSICAACGNPQGTLNGDVFIVTAGGGSIKLGLVEVKVLPLEETKAKIHLADETKANEVSELQTQMHELGDKLLSAKAVCDQYRREQKEAYDRFEEHPFAGPRYDAWEEAHKRVQKATDAAEVIQRKMDDLQKQIQSSRSSVAMYYPFLPQPIASAKTDADGKFSIELDRHSPFALAATTSRELPSGEETYHWLISASLDGQATKRIFLSNDNLAEACPPESLICPEGKRAPDGPGQATPSAGAPQ
jgi:hypothetical protein